MIIRPCARLLGRLERGQALGELALAGPAAAAIAGAGRVS